MGNYISNNTVLLSAKRLLMRYNIENRAFRELDRQAIRPVVAPKHDADIVDYRKSLSENKGYQDKVNVVNEELDSRLKDVYVTSTGVTENIKNTKPMPQNRFRETFPLGFKESERIPPGRVSLVQAMKLLSDQQSSPAEWTVDRIASEYKIKSQLAIDIIRYYRIFEVHCSADSTGKKMLPEADADLETLSGQKKIQ